MPDSLINGTDPCAWEARTRRLNELALALARAALPGETVSEAKYVYCSGLCTLDARDFPPGCVPVVILRPLSPVPHQAT